MGRFSGWLWRRYRRHYTIAVAILALISMHTFLTLPVIAIAGTLLNVSFGETVLLAIVAISIINCAAVLSVSSHRSLTRALHAWGRGDRSDPVAAWNAALRLPTAFPRRSNLIGAPAHVLVTMPLVVALADLSVLQTVSLVIGLGLALVSGELIFGVGMGLLTRPVLEELGPYLPIDAAPERPGPTLRYRVLMACFLGSLTSCVFGATVTRAATDGGDAFTISVLAGVAFGAYIVAIIGTGVVRPSLSPIGDLVTATRRVARGDYDEVVPVTSDDELGELAAAFNQMQFGLRQRASLQAAFGSYVDPALALRLLDSGSAVFDGEAVDVTVLFADVRNFTSYSEGVDPAEAVALLNRLFDVIVPALHANGGHANHYLGDGLLAIFGAPNPLDHHADAALAAAVDLQQRVRAEFGDELRLGVGINTGPVIAGTVGGGGRLEFTVIGDTVNVASRVEQATKETGDAILLTAATRAALSPPRPRLRARGDFHLPGKAGAVTLHAVDPFRGLRRRSA